jgi:hypothetical protein
MPFWPNNLTGWVDVVTKGLATLFALIGGGWGLYQYFRSTRIRAAETLLKLEEEFRNVFATYEEIEESYREIVKPVLDAEREGTLDDAGLKKLTQLDRCLRFFYLSSVLNETLRVDSAFGVKGGALPRAYYYYLGILLPEERGERPELFAYADCYYPKLTGWIERHAPDLRIARTPD